MPNPDLLGDAVRRRDFVKAIAGSVALWPLAIRAQQTGRLPTIGFLGTVTPSTWPWEAFERRLRELGWIDGKTVRIDCRWAAGNTERISAYAAEFVHGNVSVIVTGGNGVAAVKQATSTIPIVFAMAVDPVGSGFVDSLSHPGGNVTGLSLEGPDLAGKRLELLREVAPNRHRLGVLVNVTYPAAEKELAEVQTAAKALGFQTTVLSIRKSEDIAPTFDKITDRVDTLYVIAEALVHSNLAAISALALGAHLPSVYGDADAARVGALLSYGPSMPDMLRRTADMTDMILHGKKPADIPVEQPIKFEFMINLKTAKALGLTVPSALVALADDVVE
jgi:putative tryptophan/tyrosine transport system substrate-binding protein